MPGFFVPVIATHVVYQNVVYTVDQFYTLISGGANPIGNLTSYTPTLDGSLSGGVTVTTPAYNCSRSVFTGPDGVKYVFCEGNIDFTTGGIAGTPLKLTLPAGLPVTGGGLIGFGCDISNGSGVANQFVGIMETNDSTSVAVWRSPANANWTLQAFNRIRFNFMYRSN